MERYRYLERGIAFFHPEIDAEVTLSELKNKIHFSYFESLVNDGFVDYEDGRIGILINLDRKQEPNFSDTRLYLLKEIEKGITKNETKATIEILCRKKLGYLNQHDINYLFKHGELFFQEDSGYILTLVEEK